jgi:hypothetical protein
MIERDSRPWTGIGICRWRGRGWDGCGCIISRHRCPEVLSELRAFSPSSGRSLKNSLRFILRKGGSN